nr:uncharacterized protein LOC127321592 isoform X1 [Lolium perenne]
MNRNTQGKPPMTVPTVLSSPRRSVRPRAKPRVPGDAARSPLQPGTRNRAGTLPVATKLAVSPSTPAAFIVDFGHSAPPSATLNTPPCSWSSSPATLRCLPGQPTNLIWTAMPRRTPDANSPASVRPESPDSWSTRSQSAMAVLAPSSALPAFKRRRVPFISLTRSHVCVSASSAPRHLPGPAGQPHGLASLRYKLFPSFPCFSENGRKCINLAKIISLNL